ncbi:hypothetical protein F8Z73_11645 [Escherichia coli]|nr:hypothetical protein F8Z73_11645 [Escherichia coli]
MIKRPRRWKKIWDDVKTWTSDAWAWIGDHTLGALSLITDVVAGTVEQVKLLLVQGDLALAEFIQSAWENDKECARRWCVVW